MGTERFQEADSHWCRLALGPGAETPWPGSRKKLMRVNEIARRSVVFFGVPGPDGIGYGGTGFMLCDEEQGILIPLLVTCRHVARELEKYSDTGFYIRANKLDGEAEDIPVTSIIWSYHPDPTVDLAAATFGLSNTRYDTIYWPLKDPAYGPMDRIARYGGPDDVLCGDPISIIGLFRLHAGKRRNVPVVHNGHIAALPNPNEPIPVQDRSTKTIIHSEAYLVEAQTLEGLSGSPVFTMEALQLGSFNPVRGALPASYGALVLLGLYIGAWDGRPGEILAKDRNLSGGLRVPIGMGTVVPAYKIVELVRTDKALLAERRARIEAIMAHRAVQQDSAFPPPAKKAVEGSERPATPVEGDDQHKESVSRLY